SPRTSSAASSRRTSPGSAGPRDRTARSSSCSSSSPSSRRPDRSRTMEHRQRHDPSKNLVGFVVGDVQYAVPIARVREIANPLPTAALPHAPNAVIGVADYRGEVVPVVELRLRFDLPRVEPTRKTKWIVVDVAGRVVALVVDAVTEVFGTGGAELRPA